MNETTEKDFSCNFDTLHMNLVSIGIKYVTHFMFISCCRVDILELSSTIIYISQYTKDAEIDRYVAF